MKSILRKFSAGSTLLALGFTFTLSIVLYAGKVDAASGWNVLWPLLFLLMSLGALAVLIMVIGNSVVRD